MGASRPRTRHPTAGRLDPARSVSPPSWSVARSAARRELDPHLDADHPRCSTAPDEAASELPNGIFRRPFLLKNSAAELAHAGSTRDRLLGHLHLDGRPGADAALHRRRLRRLRQDQHSRVRRPADGRKRRYGASRDPWNAALPGGQPASRGCDTAASSPPTPTTAADDTDPRLLLRAGWPEATAGRNGFARFGDMISGSFTGTS